MSATTPKITGLKFEIAAGDQGTNEPGFLTYINNVVCINVQIIVSLVIIISYEAKVIFWRKTISVVALVQLANHIT